MPKSRKTPYRTATQGGPKDAPTVDHFSDRIQIGQLREIWDEDGIVHTDAELLMVRDWLYVIAELVIDVVEKKKKQETEMQHQMPSSFFGKRRRSSIR